MEIREILVNTFNNSAIPDDIADLKMGDLDEWDSLGNFNLIMAVEEEYKVQFDIDSIENMTSVREIMKELNCALSKQ